MRPLSPVTWQDWLCFSSFSWKTVVVGRRGGGRPESSMSERPVSAGDHVLVRLEVTQRLNDGYLIVARPGLSAITVHEDDLVRESSLAAKPPRLVAVG